MSKSYNQRVAQAINRFLKDDDWNYSFDEDNGTFTFNLSIQAKIKSLHYKVRVRDDDYLVYAVSNISADEDDAEQMQEMAEFICRANYGLVDGNFELDFRDGELRYKCFEDCEDGIIPTDAIIRNSIAIPASMFRRYTPGIVGILFNSMSASDAIDLCEDNN